MTENTVFLSIFLGYVYTTGYFRDTADFNIGAGTSDLISAGLADASSLDVMSSLGIYSCQLLSGTQYNNGKCETRNIVNLV